MDKIEIKICLGSSCFARSNKDTVQKIKELIRENNAEEKVKFSGGHCFSRCEKGPILFVNGVRYEMVSTTEALSIIKRTLKIDTNAG